MKEITRQWLRSPNDDLKVIEKIVDDELLTHQVAFHAQQCIEKLLKAIMEEFEIEFIKTHSLETLLDKTKYLVEFPVEIEIIKKFDQLYIEARYPSEYGLLPNGKPSLSEASNYYNYVKKVFYAVENYFNTRN
ncbi:HEPN domain-containing protein [Bacteroidota bacterium]